MRATLRTLQDGHQWVTLSSPSAQYLADPRRRLRDDVTEPVDEGGPLKKTLAFTACTVAAAVMLALTPAAGAQTPEDSGTIVFDSDGTILTVDAGGASRPQAVEPDDDVDDDFAAHPDLSPDGSTIAFVRKVGDDFDLWTMGIDGSDPQRLTWSAAEASAPAWSPDGRRIAFSGTRRGKTGLYVIDANGRRLRRLRAGDHGQPAWSPNGHRIAFTSRRKGNTDIYTSRLNGTGLRRVTAAPGVDSQPEWSPDGKKIAFAGYHEVLAEKAFVVPARGRGRTLVPLSDCDDECYVDSVAWSPDGTALAVAYMHETDWAFRIVAVRADGTESEILSFGWSVAWLSWS